eukprot:6544254-Prymnesium_polylepis.2
MLRAPRAAEDEPGEEQTAADADADADEAFDLEAVQAAPRFLAVFHDTLRAVHEAGAAEDPREL